MSFFTIRRSRQLQTKLRRSIVKGNCSITEFFVVLAIVDSLSSIGDLIHMRDLFGIVLVALSSDFDSFVVVDRGLDMTSLSELVSLLLAHESFLEKNERGIH